MTQTNRQTISDVIGLSKSLGYDDRFSNRFILSLLQDDAKSFIKQDTDGRRLLSISDVWYKIDCFPLCEEDEVCEDVPDCQVVRKSKIKVPKVFESSYGDLIKVFTVDFNNEYTQIKPFEYKDIKNREYQDPNKKYFWILDDYIYIPDSEVKAVIVIGLFQNPAQARLINGDIDECYYPLDDIFPCPDYLLTVVKTSVSQKIAQLSKRIVEDEKPDGNVNAKA